MQAIKDQNSNITSSTNKTDDTALLIVLFWDTYKGTAEEQRNLPCSLCMSLHLFHALFTSWCALQQNKTKMRFHDNLLNKKKINLLSLV